MQPCFQKDSLVHLGFGAEMKVMTIPHGGLKSAESLSGFGDLRRKFIVDFSAESECAAQLFVKFALADKGLGGTA
ncbi:hypothetical protein SprV_0200803700 [Sparganum proliferum]